MTEPENITEAEVVGAELAVVDHQPPPALFKTDDPVEVIEKATAVANALKNVLDSQNLIQQIAGRAKDNNGNWITVTREHVKVEGWTTLGAMLGVTAVCVGTEPIEKGFKATVEARMPDGRVVGRADAICTRAENRWGKADDYAVMSMAQTRATSKALRGPLGFVVALAGYATTPAEEMTGVAEPAPEPEQNGGAPAGGKPLSAAARGRVVKAIEAADQPVNLMLKAAGIDEPEEMTAEHARKIRAILDGAA